MLCHVFQLHKIFLHVSLYVPWVLKDMFSSDFPTFPQAEPTSLVASSRSPQHLLQLALSKERPRKSLRPTAAPAMKHLYKNMANMTIKKSGWCHFQPKLCHKFGTIEGIKMFLTNQLVDIG